MIWLILSLFLDEVKNAKYIINKCGLRWNKMWKLEGKLIVKIKLPVSSLFFQTELIEKK